MKIVEALKPESLYQRCDVDQLGFQTTEQLEDLTEVVGQDRALEAVRFGIGIRREGYNLFALGPPGHGKRAMIAQYLGQKAAGDPLPSDWCYVNNFEQPHKPLALRFPAGRGRQFQEDMGELVAELRLAIPTVFESQEYRDRRQEFDDDFSKKKSEALERIKQEAAKNQIGLIRTPVGFAFSPTREGRALSPEEFQKLPDDQQEKIAKLLSTLEHKLEKAMRQIAEWRKQRREKINDFNCEIATFAVGHFMDGLKEKYADFPGVLAYLEAVRQDVIKHVEDFRGQEETPVPVLSLPARDKDGFRRYGVNLLVDHSGSKGAPVVYEEHPTHQNLIGRVEHESQLGTLLTDFTLIKPGALHRANGGYLVLDAQKLLMQPFAWEALKRAMFGREIRMESVGNMLGLVSTVSLEPEPVPLDIKIVLLGEQLLYYLLYQFDIEFNELFKVAVDFEDRINRSPENGLMYARLVATLVRKEGLHHFDDRAVGRVIEHSARLAGDAQKLSAHIGAVTDLLREADYWAGQNRRDVVTADDVQRAIDARVHRVSRLRDLLDEQIQRGILLIETQGAKIGQVNGLSVVELGDFAFARPSRITATTRMGSGDVIDIEREVKLGGAIHSKGVLILSQFLAARYSRDRPFSLAASLVFEQSYGAVEGDSASLAELCSLLSALSEAPIKQSLAVTGSVNQRGQVQAVGSVNEKIEGFFDACHVQGLTGDQGVLIPASNAQHLMLRRDVVEAAAAGRFHIYPVATVDDAIQLLTGMAAGQRDQEGQFPEGSVNHFVESRLMQLSAIRQQYSKGGEDEDEIDAPPERPARS